MITDFSEAMSKLESVYRKHEDGWVEVSANIAQEMLEVLWPAYWEGDKFASGEAYSHRGGKAVYHCFRKHNSNTAEARICTIEELQAA